MPCAVKSSGGTTGPSATGQQTKICLMVLCGTRYLRHVVRKPDHKTIGLGTRNGMAECGPELLTARKIKIRARQFELQKRIGMHEEGGGGGVALRAMHAWLRRTGGAGGGLGLSVRLSGELDKHGRLAEGPGLCVGAGAVLGKGLGGCLGVSGGKRLLERLCGSGGVGAALGLAAARGAGGALRRRLCRGLHARALCHGCDNKPRRRGRLLPGTRSPDNASTRPGLTAVTRLQARSAG